MYIRPLLLLCFAVLSFTACNNSGGNSEGMEQFAQDAEFKDAHEQPEAIAYEGLGESVQFPTPDGRQAGAYRVAAANPSGKTLLLIHEWWGLNNQIRQEADRLATELGDVNVLALDMYDGQVTDNPDKAGELMQGIDEARAEAIVQGALSYIGETEKVATMGWCFGGGWSLRASILAGEQSKACVIYYGMPVKKAKELAPLKAEILGIFATKDKWINDEVVNDFAALTAATGKSLEVHWFNADHAFANPSSPRYQEAEAQKANEVALKFLRARL